MRILLFVLVVLAAIIGIEKPAEAQNGGWCAYNNYGYGGQRICGFATLQQCLAEVRGVGGNCGTSPYPSSPRRHQSTRHRPSYSY